MRSGPPEGVRAKLMPDFESRYFGAVAYQPDSVVHFPRGLPGFEDERGFLLIEQAVNKPVVFLQSLASAELCFITLPVSSIMPGYQLSLSEEELAALELAEHPPGVDDPGLVCLAVVSLAQGQPVTVNLLSPIVIHWRRRLALQSIPAAPAYSHRHPLAPVAAGDAAANRQEVRARQ